MQAAPPVSVRCTGGAAWLAAQGALAGVAAGTLCLWVLGSAETVPSWSRWVGAAAAVASVAGVVCLWWWRVGRHRTAALLTWDGQGWQIDGRAGQLGVMIDLGRWLLLRFDPDPASGPMPRRCWLPLQAGAAGAAWHALRVAVHASAPAASALASAHAATPVASVSRTTQQPAAAE